MKVSPVSADLLIKLALVAAGAGLVYFAWRKLSNAVSGPLDSLSNAATQAFAEAGIVADAVITGVNPASSENIVNRGVTAIGDSIVSPDGYGRNADGSWTLGGWFYDITHDTRERDNMNTLPPVQGHQSAYWKS